MLSKATMEMSFQSKWVPQNQSITVLLIDFAAWFYYKTMFFQGDTTVGTAGHRGQTATNTFTNKKIIVLYSYLRVPTY